MAIIYDFLSSKIHVSFSLALGSETYRLDKYYDEMCVEVFFFFFMNFSAKWTLWYIRYTQEVRGEGEKCIIIDIN